MLHKRPEWEEHRHQVHIAWKNAVRIVQNISCRESPDCPKRWRSTYFLQNLGHAAGTLLITTFAEHEHGEGVAGARPGKLFTPKQQQAAQQYLELTPKGSRNAQSLRDHLLSKGLKSADLPTLEQFSAWMKNQKRTPVSQQQRQSDAGVTVAPTVAALSDWPRSGETVDALYLLEGFVHVSEQRVFVAYTCRGMLATLRRYVGDVVHLAVDAKMKVPGGMGVATLSLLVKDGLRNTNLCHQETGRVQGRAHTTHAMPFLQATMRQESEQNYASLFEAAEVATVCAPVAQRLCAGDRGSQACGFPAKPAVQRLVSLKTEARRDCSALQASETRQWQV